jgi:nucleotide-binding universal stress UspA family protein
MSYATLLLYVNVDHVAPALVRLAAGLAERFSATLIGTSAQAVPPPFVAEGVVIVDAASEADIRKMQASLDEAERRFREAAGTSRPVEWRSALDHPAATLVREAREADLVVFGHQRGPIDPYRTLDSTKAILEVGRPTLVVPEAVTSLRAERIVIGWKDSREARRAVQDALPFLQQAAKVIILEICDDEETAAARERLDGVARYLKRHAIDSEPRAVAATRHSGADRLIDIAEDEGADLIVTGAYGHSRFNEWVFGGVTRDLLTASPLACLMSH